MPVRFALLRIRAHAQRSLVVATGISVAAAVLAMTAVGSVAVQDRAAQRALAALQPSDRSVQAVWSGVPGQSDLSLPQLDALARTALAPVLDRQPFAVAVFRQATWGGAFINLGAVVGLLPVSGITLPFLSAGGSSLVVAMAAAGMLANIARQATPAPARTREAPSEAR